jgi:Helicase HerA, central domain
MTMWALENDSVEFDGTLDLSVGPLLGVVRRLDRSWIEVELSDRELAPRVTVSDLVALPTATQFVVGIIEAVTRRADEGKGEAGQDECPIDLRIMPIGAFTAGETGAPGSFTRGASSYPHIGGDCHLIDGQPLHAFMQILAEDVAAGQRLVLGRYVGGNGAPAVADGNRLFQRHLALLGSTGAGKSWAVALMLERAARLPHANLIVFDLHGEYTPLTQSVNGLEPVARGLRVAGPGDLGRLSDDLLYLPYWLLRRDELMSLVLNENDPYSPDQILRFTEHVQTLKQVSLVDIGREDEVTRFTVDSPIPYRVENLIRMLEQDNTERIPQHPSNRVEPGPYYGRLTGFIARLFARTQDPRFGFIFDAPPETLSYEWLTDTAATLLESGPGSKGVKIIDLSQVPSAALPIVIGVLARFIYDVQFWMEPERRVPISLVCDEAHLYLPSHEEREPIHEAALSAFESIAKEGRKYGVGLLVVSQRPSDVSRTILSQCNNFIVMRVANDQDQAMIERLAPEMVAGVKGVLPVLDVGEAVVIGDALMLTSRIRFDMPRLKPSSATQRYWSMWSEQPSSRDAINAGVEALRNQLRGGA